jgi:hypothetical protein
MAWEVWGSEALQLTNHSDAERGGGRRNLLFPAREPILGRSPSTVGSRGRTRYRGGGEFPRAFEWDYFDASYKESEKAEVKRFRAKALRILRRQKDGSWKFARVMWNLVE